MNIKIYNLALILSGFIGYLEWGDHQSLFLIQGEWEILQKIISDPLSAAHPFVVLPMVGQFLLLITLFQKKPSRWLTWSGMAGIGILLLFMLFIGILGLNIKIAASTLPFLMVAFFTIRQLRSEKLMQKSKL